MENRDCEKVLELLSAYIDGELSESDAEFVRAHLEICPDFKRGCTLGASSGCYDKDTRRKSNFGKTKKIHTDIRRHCRCGGHITYRACVPRNPSYRKWRS